MTDDIFDKHEEEVAELIKRESATKMKVGDLNASHMGRTISLMEVDPAVFHGIKRYVEPGYVFLLVGDEYLLFHLNSPVWLHKEVSK